MKTIQEFYNESPTKTRTRATIIETAIDLFCEAGIDGASLVDIADKCNITIRNLYRYYANKEMLAVDAAYKVIIEAEHIDEMTINPDLNGYENVENIIKIIYMNEETIQFGLQASKFIMYFDLYISKMDKAHPAFILYTTEYVKEMNTPIKALLREALEKGIKDGSVLIKRSDIELYEEYIIQSTISLLMRVMIKESENKALNRSLVEKHIEVILNHIGNH